MHYPVVLLPLLQFGLFLGLLTALVKPVGHYLLRVFERQKTWPGQFLEPVERATHRICGIDPSVDMDWKAYFSAFLIFSLVGTTLLFGLLWFQKALPFYDPVHLTTGLTPDLLLNTAVSFSTTTTWQAYAGESTMSYFSQLVGLVTQNFLAGASGLAVGMAFIRGLSREEGQGLGNFWSDLIRALLWVLLPASLVVSLLLVWQGVPMNFSAYSEGKTLEGVLQVIAQGPVAAMESIKNLGTNGGGFFNANGAHPYECPTPLANLIEMLSIAVMPAALTHTFGRMVRQPRQGWMIYGVMVFLFVGGLAALCVAEQGNLEGKETRFGVSASVLATAVTSNGATGSYNSMLDSYSALGGMIPLFNMLLGEIVFGGLGTGLFSMLLVVLLSVFVGSLMVGRAPEYLGKSIGPVEMKVIAIYTIIAPAVILGLTAIAVATPAGRTALTTNVGAHGLTGILNAYTSSFANNGLSFAGLSVNSPFYNLTTALAMALGRYGLVGLALMLAGHLVKKRSRPQTEGSLPTDSILFAGLVVGMAVIVGALSYFPVLALGPILEHLRGS